MHKIKIVFFIDSFRIGGMHKQILILLQNIDKDKFTPIVISSTFEGRLYDDYNLTGCELLCLNWKGTFDFGIVYRLSKVLKSTKPDIIFIPLAVNFLYYRLSRIFFKRKVIQIGSFRALDFWKGNKGGVYKIVDDFFVKWLYRTSSVVTTNSNALRLNYSKVIGLNNPKCIRLIYNGNNFNFVITKSKERVLEEIGLKDKIMIVMVARLDPWKDFDTLIEAVKMLNQKNKNFVVYLIGDGVLMNELKQKINLEELNDKIILLGEKKNVHDYVNTSDISVLSTFGEGFSNSIMESMALGKPVVATAVGGNPEALGDNQKCGLLVSLKDPLDLSEKLLKLIEDFELRNQIGDEGKKRIRKICDVKNYVNSYEELFIETFEKN